MAKTKLACVRCGKEAAALPWCSACTDDLYLRKIDLNADSPFQRIFAKLVSVWESGDPVLLSEVYAEDVVIESPGSGASVSGLASLVDGLRTILQAGGELARAQAFDDHGKIWFVEVAWFHRTNKHGRVTSEISINDGRIAKVVVHTTEVVVGPPSDIVLDKGWSAERLVGVGGPGASTPATKWQPSASGMRWFYTPDEYLAHYRGYIEVDAERQAPSACPHCKGSRIERKIPDKSERRRFKRTQKLTEEQAADIREVWLCRATFCTWGGILTRYSDQKVRQPLSRQDFVFRSINNMIDARRQLLSVGILPNGEAAPAVKGPGIIGALARMEMYSRDPETARTGMAYTAINTYEQSQQRQQQQRVVEAAWAEFAAEAQHAWNLAVGFFNREESVAAQAGASVAEEERIKLLAREMAKEMMAEFRRQSSGGGDTETPVPSERRGDGGESSIQLMPGESESQS